MQLDQSLSKDHLSAPVASSVMSLVVVVDFYTKNLAQDLVLKAPYLWSSFYQILVLRVPL